MSAPLDTIKIERFVVSTKAWLSGLHAPFGDCVFAAKRADNSQGYDCNITRDGKLSRFFTPGMVVRTAYTTPQNDNFIMFEQIDNSDPDYHITIGYVPDAV